MRWTKAFHFSEEYQCCLAIPVLSDIAFKHFAFVILSPPKVVRLAANLYENLVEMPLPVRISPHPARSIATDFSNKHWAKSVPPKTDRFVAYIDAPLVKNIIDIPKR